MPISAPPLPPAPGAAEYPALDFVNSAVALPDGHIVDMLATPQDATRWLVERELTAQDAELQEYCASRLRGLREQIRLLIGARTCGLRPSQDAIRAVNEALTSVPTASLLRWDADHGMHRAAVHPATQAVEHALAALAADAAGLLTNADADRLAACAAPSCNRYLLRTHARRHWCSTRCGDRVRAARAYARRNSPAARNGRGGQDTLGVWHGAVQPVAPTAVGEL